MRCSVCNSVINKKDEFFVYNNEVICVECCINRNILKATYYYDRDTAIKEIESMINYHDYMFKYLDNYDEHNQFTDMKNNYYKSIKQEKELIKKLKE